MGENRSGGFLCVKGRLVKLNLSGRVRALSWVAVALVFGLLLSLQLNSAPRTADRVSADGRDATEATIRRLEEEQESLKARIGQLRQELTSYQQEMAATTELLEEINAELGYQRALAGLAAAKGPGLEVTLDDSPRQKIPAGEDPSSYIVHEYDLRDLVNLFWLAGAEGIAINEERVVGVTSIYCVGSTVMVNDTRLSPPYQVRAIGDSRRLEDHVRNPSYLAGIKEKVRRNGLVFKYHRVSSVSLPAYQGSFVLKYARPGR